MDTAVMVSDCHTIAHVPPPLNATTTPTTPPAMVPAMVRSSRPRNCRLRAVTLACVVCRPISRKVDEKTAKYGWRPGSP